MSEKSTKKTSYLLVEELTESLSAEGFEKLVEVVTDLKLLGFRVSLDDFGQGYFYAKPMPSSEYIDYLKKGNFIEDIQQYMQNHTEDSDKSYLHVIPQEFQMDIWDTRDRSFAKYFIIVLWLLHIRMMQLSCRKMRNS